MTTVRWSGQYVVVPDTVRTPLADGTFCEVEWIGPHSVLISRRAADGEAVWGQAFGGDRVMESIESCRASMLAKPDQFLSLHRRGV